MALEKDAPFSWIYLAASVLVVLTIEGFNVSSGVFVAILIEQFHESNAKTGWVASLILFLVYAFCPLVIHTHQSLGFRRCMAIAGFLFIVAFLASPFMPSLNLLFFTYSIPFGISMSFVVQLTVRTQKEYFQKYYGFAMGVRYSGIALGAVVMSFFIPIIYGHLGFQGTMLSLLCFSPVFLIYALVSRTHLVTTHRLDHKMSLSAKLKLYRDFIQDRSFLFSWLAITLFFTINHVHLIFVVRYGVTLGYPLSKAKWLLMIRNITTLPARLVVGRLSDIARRHRKIKLLVQIFWPMFGLASFICSFTRSFPMLMLFMGCIGIIDAVIWVTFPLFVDEIAGGYHSDEAFSLACFSSAFALMAGPPAMGWIFDVTEDFRYVFYSIFAISLLVASLLLLSSCVTVKPEVSLREKDTNKRIIIEDHELTKNNDEERREIIYETAI